MTRLRRGGAAVALTLAALLLGAAPSYAGDSFQDCVNKAIDHNGEPPTCTKVNGSWVASWPDDGSTAGFGGGFVAFAVFALIVGIAITVWKVSTAQKLAKQSGMDPGLATQMTLLSDDGLDATYLASSLRPQPPPPPASATPTASTAARLAELKGLLDQGLVTQAEYDERRRAIIGSI
jgi:hypothetical protein